MVLIELYISKDKYQITSILWKNPTDPNNRKPQKEKRKKNEIR